MAAASAIQRRFFPEPISLACRVADLRQGGCMALFDGLYLYEIVLLVCGVVLFLGLLVALLRKVFLNQDYKNLLFFFVLPIAMIGFPSITSIQVKDGVVEIDKTTHDLQSKPQDQQTRAALESQVLKIETRPFKDPTVLATLARAQFALGDESKAESNLNTALAAAPNLAPAVELKSKIDLTKNVRAQTVAAESHPDDARVQEELQRSVAKLSQVPLANPKAIATLSKAQAVLQKNAAVSH
jgi:hypothetical protein